VTNPAPTPPASLPDVPNYPVSLKSLSVDSHGKLSQRRAVGPLGFTFSAADTRYACRFYERAGQAGLTLRTTLGTMPKGDATRPQRAALREIAKQARLQGIALIIRRDGRIDLEYKTRPQVPVTGPKLLTHLTLATLTLTPWTRQTQALSR
jgi:hypothetical protein